MSQNFLFNASFHLLLIAIDQEIANKILTNGSHIVRATYIELIIHAVLLACRRNFVITIMSGSAFAVTPAAKEQHRRQSDFLVVAGILRRYFYLCPH
jgi:hypothetical protein